jgi:ABC-type sulfate/molybdate transport systems ATPase subunit
MSEIELIDVRNRFLKDIRLKVSDGEIFVIVGPSGSGKTSLLRAIAGLAAHDGKIVMDGREIQRAPTHQRRIGYVSQDLHLFPHLTLEGNLLIAMDRLPAPKSRKRRRAGELVELLRIAPLIKRYPSMLSGGEKQRAALARVLASEPKILLLDEPLSKLDFRTARYLRSELRALLKRLSVTTIFVTHNMDEAREMGDDLAVLSEGKLTHTGRPDEMPLASSYPGDGFLERPNILQPVSKEFSGNGLVKIAWAGLRWSIPDEGREFTRVAVSPSRIDIATEPPLGPSINRFTAIVSSVSYSDDSVRLTVKVNSEILRVEMPAERGQRLKPVPGDVVHGLVRLTAFELM